tara:strand:+ start:866 stop:1447 length:582 start_codon:yes stop_codon:yes gene_type:complete
MSIVDDIKKDPRTKRVLVNTKTKTVGPPLSATGLTGDQAPETIFSADDYDLIRNQVVLEDENFELLSALNTMGQITNMQSQSGPMVGTHKNVSVTDTNTSGNQLGIAFSPEPGQVWQLVGAATGSLNANRMELALQDRATDTYVEIGAETAAATQFDPTGIVPVYITYEVPLYYFTISQTGNCTINVSVIRVR